MSKEITTEQPTTSNACNDRSKDSLHVSHNLGDLKIWDYNSADNVRQMMKSIILSDRKQQASNDKAQSGDCQVDNKATISKMLKKRPGRPPKAGPSKKVRKMTVKDMYLGKLSNVLTLKLSRNRNRKRGKGRRNRLRKRLV